MKTIGFVDYYISEWHANNYPIWIKEINENEGKDFCVKYVWAEEYVSPVDGRNTDEWCAEFGAEKCETIDELCEKCDYVLVLAPTNPEKHLGYAKEVLKYKKNTYIDKTFAPDYATAKEIFDIAEKYGTKFFSTSALRYATELDDLVESKNVVAYHGNGTSLEEYVIHQIEMVVKTMALEPEAVRVEKHGPQYFCKVKFPQDKNAVIAWVPGMPFSIGAQKADGKSCYRSIKSDFFRILLADIIRFYETGEVSFDTKQTLSAIKIRDAIMEGKEKPGEWIAL